MRAKMCGLLEHRQGIKASLYLLFDSGQMRLADSNSL